jgi:hydrogenase-4 component B
MANLIVPQFSFFYLLLSFAIGAIGSLVLRKSDKFANWWGNGFAIIASIFGLISSMGIFLTGNVFAYALPSVSPLLFMEFRVDYLSAFFIFIISLISLMCSIYALGYVKHYYGKYNIGTLGFFYNIFIAGMVLVVSANNSVFFLVAWELMSLASYFLVIFEKNDKNNIKAGFLYFIMTHVGTAFITLMFLLLSGLTIGLANPFSFDAMRSISGTITPSTLNLIFLLALVGFGTKAGIIPFHIWLPSAHPAAPSHVSALMSGVMIKTGVYMLIRLFWDILPADQIWWGGTIIIIGAISSLLGVLYALSEHDIKRLLAFSSIENIGIIFLGLGSALVFFALGLNSFAVLALAAALYHTLNHAIFKALLFLGAGSIISGTHTRNIEEYGGLIKRMPQTALFFLIGSMAISGLPLLNGFASEWLTFQSLFNGIQSVDAAVKGLFIIAAGALVFTGGLAAACFVRAFGITFLARPRSKEAEHAKESGFPLKLGMAMLAALALIFGLFTGPVSFILSGIAAITGNITSIQSPVIPQVYVMKLQGGFAAVSMPAVLISLFFTIISVFAITFILTRRQKVKTGITWDCGTGLSPRMEITSVGFARSIIMIFKGVLKPTKQTDVEYRDADMRYFPRFKNVTLDIGDVYRTYFYKPIQKDINYVSEYVKEIQSGNINTYIFYIFVALVGLILFMI